MASIVIAGHEVHGDLWTPYTTPCQRQNGLLRPITAMLVRSATWHGVAYGVPRSRGLSFRCAAVQRGRAMPRMSHRDLESDERRQSVTLRESLSEWEDLDIAAFRLAQCIGLMKGDDTLFGTRAKHVFWSINPIGDQLIGFIQSLVQLRILESDDDDRVRWNPSFRGTWED